MISHFQNNTDCPGTGIFPVLFGVHPGHDKRAYRTTTTVIDATAPFDILF